MKYLPLVWAAFRRHATESLLTFLVLTIAFTLFSSMVALKAAYDHAINVNPMDRLLVTDRFCCGGLKISRRDEITRIPGVRGAMAVQWVFGFHQEPSSQVGISMIDEAGIAAIPELPLTPEHWKQMAAKPTGVFFTRTEAAKWNVKTGDTFPVQTRVSRREDGANAWLFEVLGIVDDPKTQVDWTPNIFGNYEYFDAVRTQSQRGTVRFIVAIDDPGRAEPICQQIDTSYANSETLDSWTRRSRCARDNAGRSRIARADATNCAAGNFNSGAGKSGEHNRHGKREHRPGADARLRAAAGRGARPCGSCLSGQAIPDVPAGVLRSIRQPARPWSFR